jgi:hypothetical protein
MAAGLGRFDYTGAGSFAIAPSGTLVYAHGDNRALGHLVRMDGASVDTLPVGREAFLRFAFESSGRRLAAVVEGLDGQELRTYDLARGRYERWGPRTHVGQPVWSPDGDRLLFTAGDTVFVGAPHQTGSPKPVFTGATSFEGFVWLEDDRVIGVVPGGFGVALHLNATPARLDTLVAGVTFIRPAPDGRWLAYTNADFTAIWLAPMAADGRRYQVAAGSVDEAQWLSASELVYTAWDGNLPRVDRMQVRATSDQPLDRPRRWLNPPRLRDTAGPSFALSPDGGFVYVAGAEDRPIRYLRVVPRWTQRMKRAVDEANR